MYLRISRICLALITVVLFFGGSRQALAQVVDDPVAVPTVYAVLFYSPTCPHCHEAIQNVMLPLMDAYGEQLVVVGIDVTTEAGNFLYGEAVSYYQVPENRQGVPTLIFEDTVLVSTMEIENEFPGLIEAALAEGGNDWPEFPGLAAVVVELTPTVSPEQAVEVVTTKAATATTESELESGKTIALTETPTVVAAVPPHEENSALSLAEIDPTTIATTATAPPPDPLGFMLGWLVLLGLAGVALFTVWQVGGSWSQLVQADASLNSSPSRSVLVRLLILAGFVVSGYLAYVEMTHVTAVCGPVGECNIVQSSPYARIAGIPVALLGLLFYLSVAVLWLLQRVEKRRHLAILALVAITFLGLMFSIYLTLLELLVIGAICAWCLTSALITALLCLLVVTAVAKRPLPPDPQWQTEKSSRKGAKT